MALDLNCPSCASDTTQRLSMMRSQQTAGGTLGKGQTVLAASFQEPRKPWASTIGFVIGLCTIPIVSAFSGRSTNSPVPVIGFLLVWLGIRYWIKQTYDIQLQKWQDKLEESFICLRCGEVFTPLFDPSKHRSVLDLDSQETSEKLSNKRLGYAVMFGIALVGLAVYSVYESTSRQTPKPLDVSKPVVSSSTSPSRARTDVNPAHDRLQRMSSADRNSFLTKWAQGSGESCDVVIRSFHQGTGKTGDVFWNVACRNGQAYSIMIYNDAEGSNKVVSCAVLKALNGGECFKKFKE